MKTLIAALAVTLAFTPQDVFAQKKKAMSQHEMVDVVLAATQPLKFPRGERLPLYLWPLHGLGTTNEAEAVSLLKSLDARGLPVIATWNPAPARREQSLRDALWLGRLQKKLGLPITINASSCMNSFCNGDEKTAHVGDDGKPFFDDSFEEKRPMGCPFALGFRHPAIREQVEFFLEAYQREGLDIHLVFVDWEVDGPIEWNGAWAHSKRCRRCREHIPDIADFAAFQKALREIRCRMQRECFAGPVLKKTASAGAAIQSSYQSCSGRFATSCCAK